MPPSITWMYLQPLQTLLLYISRKTRELVEEYKAMVKFLKLYLCTWSQLSKKWNCLLWWIARANIDFCLYGSSREETNHVDFSAILNFYGTFDNFFQSNLLWGEDKIMFSVIILHQIIQVVTNVIGMVIKKCYWQQLSIMGF